MERAAIDDVENQPSPLGVHGVRRPVSDALGTTDFALNYFELDPGESFSGGLHTHHDQEEIFYVEEGTATFDVPMAQVGGGSDDPDFDDLETVAVAAGELVRFAPGEFQEGYNDGDEPVVGWALGAPQSRHDWDEIETVVHCRECDGETGHGLALTDEGRFRMTCNTCGASFTM